MRRLVPLLLVLAAMTANAADKPKTALVIHGGAGVIERSHLSAEDEKAIRADLNRALDAGNAVLAKGGAAVDAVQAAIQVMEDSPRFNAGKGAVFNAKGGHELDSAIMEGHTRRAGAVAGVTTVRHPVALARAVMEHSPHVMLAGAGAEAFADSRPELERVPNSWFDTERRRKQLEQAQADEKRPAALGLPPMKGTYFVTFGAVALDAQGHVAAATSTGGMTNKKWGRVGDSPIIGAGTWADNETCAISCTGHGEYFMRAVVAHDIHCLMAYKGLSLQEACDLLVHDKLVKAGGEGGLVAVDGVGNIAMPFNSEGMYRACRNSAGTEEIRIYKD